MIAEPKGVTEVFVTKVCPSKLEAYRLWVNKIHEAETKFAGFQRVYVQAPKSEKNQIWITLVQFDTVAHLEAWLNSEERQRILKEAQALIESMESHRMTSPFAGWFSELSAPPPVWKQTMLVLLVLFPIVMLEFKFLVPFTTSLSLSLGTFIGNAISVTLVSWPLMPVAIYGLSWWLNASANMTKVIAGTGFVCLLYFLEILLFWSF